LAEVLGDRVEVITGDLRATVAAIAAGEIDAVAHLGVLSSPGRGGRSAMKEHNIIGTMQLLAACQAAPNLSKVVVRSSTAAYGASFRDPAIFTESTPPTLVPRGGFAKDVIEIEGYVRGFSRRRADVTTTVLRFAPFVGAHADTTLTRYFGLPVVPTVFGRDPRLQFIHIEDALEVLTRAVVEEHHGTFNAAGPGVLVLSQALRRANRIGVPVVEQGMSAFAAFVRASGLGDFSLDQLDLFVHGRVVDTTRLTEEFGFRPRSTEDAFADYVSGQARRRSGRFASLRPDAIVAAESRILEGIRAVRSSAVTGPRPPARQPAALGAARTAREAGHG
jgi:UDP-glucose 4-epimerase